MSETTFSPSSNHPEGLTKTLNQMAGLLRDESTDTVCQAACSAIDFALRRKSEQSQRDYDIEQAKLRKLQVEKENVQTEITKKTLKVQAERLDGLRELERLLSDYKAATETMIEHETSSLKNDIKDIVKEQCDVVQDLDRLDYEIKNPKLPCSEPQIPCGVSIEKHL